MKKISGGILLLFVSVWFYSCKDEYTICNLAKSVYLMAGFYQKQSGTDVSVQASNFTISTLNGSGAIYSNVNLHTFSLPLNPQADSAQYVIAIGNTQADTLTIVYNTQSTNLSEDCGNIFIHNITKTYTTAHTLDSARIVNPAVTTGPVENLRIYF